MTNGKIRILLVEKLDLVRAGFKALLTDVPDFEVVAEADDGSAIELLATYKPEVVLMDVNPLEMQGLATARHIIRQFPDIKIIFLSNYSEAEYVLQALDAGASGYLLKDSSTAQFKQAIRWVVSGHTFLCQEVQNSIKEYSRQVRDENTQAKEPLTPRQNQVLQLIIDGYTTRQIAAQLNLSEKTIESHRAEIMRRLRAKNLPDLVRIAIQIGLYPLHQK